MGSGLAAHTLRALPCETATEPPQPARANIGGGVSCPPPRALVHSTPLIGFPGASTTATLPCRTRLTVHLACRPLSRTRADASCGARFGMPVSHSPPDPVSPCSLSELSLSSLSTCRAPRTLSSACFQLYNSHRSFAPPLHDCMRPRSHVHSRLASPQPYIHARVRIGRDNPVMSDIPRHAPFS